MFRIVFAITALLFSLNGLYGQAVPGCYRQLETGFFNDDAAMIRAYTLYRIPQSLWSLITNDVRARAAQVPGMDNYRARQYNPNPLAEPFQPDLALQIMFQSQYEIFSSSVLQYASLSNGVINDNSILGMFNYIKSSQANRISQCFRSGQQ